MTASLYFFTCVMCFIGICILAKIEPNPSKNTSTITLISFVILLIPLLPVVLPILFITKIIRNG